MSDNLIIPIKKFFTKKEGEKYVSSLIPNDEYFFEFNEYKIKKEPDITEDNIQEIMSNKTLLFNYNEIPFYYITAFSDMEEDFWLIFEYDNKLYQFHFISCYGGQGHLYDSFIDVDELPEVEFDDNSGEITILEGDGNVHLFPIEGNLVEFYKNC